jgi:branched-subunit amino acid aminotransferase/4-amino-4-deoxychorismate lyase
MKVSRGDDGKIRLFRPDLNVKRMLTSAERSVLSIGAYFQKNLFPELCTFFS